MSILARSAFGLVCLEQACSHLAIRSARLDALLQRLWRKVESGKLEGWSCDGEIEDVPALLGQMLRELDEIGGGNLYGGFRNEFTLTPTLNLARLLETNGIPLPPRPPFSALSPRRWWDAWGQPIDVAELRQRLAGES
jgi:hypothetical protein